MRAAYFAALKLRKLLNKFWTGHSDWRKNARSAISVHLDQLWKTCNYQGNQHLSICGFKSLSISIQMLNIWARRCLVYFHSPDVEYMIVQLFRSENT